MRFHLLALPITLGLLALGCAGAAAPNATSSTTTPTSSVEVLVLQDTVSMKVNENYTLEGAISGSTPDKSLLLWTITSGQGTLTPQGPTGLDFHCKFTAPATPGTTVVKVASKDYPNAYRNITVTITAS